MFKNGSELILCSGSGSSIPFGQPKESILGSKVAAFIGVPYEEKGVGMGLPVSLSFKKT